MCKLFKIYKASHRHSSQRRNKNTQGKITATQPTFLYFANLHDFFFSLIAAQLRNLGNFLQIHEDILLKDSYGQLLCAKSAVKIVY